MLATSVVGATISRFDAVSRLMSCAEVLYLPALPAICLASGIFNGSYVAPLKRCAVWKISRLMLLYSRSVKDFSRVR